jgi:thiol-disulfide isomerase/thioredoxin
VSRRPGYRRPARRRPRRSLLLGGALVTTLLLTTGCSGADPSPRRSAPATQGDAVTTFADCATLAVPPSAPGRPPAPSQTPEPDRTVTAGRTTGATPPVRALPALSLPCLVGDSEVQVGELRGPAVINLWASWCPPCRRELPAFQRLFARADGTVRVIGVNTRDDRAAAQSIGADLGLRFPSLFDPDQRLLRHAPRPLLPVTFFVDEQGRIRHQDQTGALDDAELARLVRQHLGVTVPS